MPLLFSILFSLLFLICITGSVSGQSIYEDCPRGTYRHSPFSRECKLCAKGHYGDTHGLTVNTCSAPCPLGRYGDNVGAKTIDDCKLVCNIGVQYLMISVWMMNEFNLIYSFLL